MFSSQILIFYRDDTKTQNSAEIKAVDCTHSTPSREETWKEHYMRQTLIMPLNALLTDTRTISVL